MFPAAASGVLLHPVAPGRRQVMYRNLEGRSMQTVRPNTWRSAAGPRPLAAPGRDAGESRAGTQRVWAIVCPSSTCDTELIIYPEHAGETVECPTCGFRFMAPRVVPMQMMPDDPSAAASPRAFAHRVPQPGALGAGAAASRPPTAADLPPKVSAAASALAALSRLARTPGAKPAPVRTPTASVPQFDPGPRRRLNRRADLYPHAAEILAGARARGRLGRRADLALMWTGAVLASAGLGLAAWLGAMPGLGLGSILVVGLAVVRTVVIAREKREPGPAV